MLYVILCSIGWILVLWFLIRPLLVIACRRTGSFSEKGPTQGIVCTIIFLVLISAWITDRIGIHAIFGGFIVGLIIPQEIRKGIVEKIEDLVTCLFLPLVRLSPSAADSPTNYYFDSTLRSRTNLSITRQRSG